MRLSFAPFFAISTAVIWSAFLTTPPFSPQNTMIEAFVPSSSFDGSARCNIRGIVPKRSKLGDAHTKSSSRCMSLSYAMPDVETMKATEMKHELESYGINTHTMIDKHEYEKALREARYHYEQTLNDVMASTRPKEKKQQQQKKKTRTVNYSRGRHHDEKIYTSDVNLNDHEERFETAFGHHPSQREQEQQRQRYQQQQQQQQRRPRHYRASPDPTGPSTNFHEQFNTAAAGTHVRAQPPPHARRTTVSSPFEQDPLFAHEAQAQGRNRESEFFDDSGGYNGGHSRHHSQSHHQSHQQQYEEYQVGTGRFDHNQQYRQSTYDDPVVERKFQAALQEAYNMKVEDLQRELNGRGISTEYCMVFKDFCHEYAKAIIDNKPKVVIKVTSVDDDDEEEEEGNDNDDDDVSSASSVFGDDGYDPLYRDVVMQKYDPSMWI